MIDDASGWLQLNVKNASMSFASGALNSTYVKKGSWAYAVHELDSAQSDVRVVGDFKTTGLGYFGWLCGDSATGRYYGAVPETDGSLVFIAGGYDGVFPLERYEDLGAPTASGSTTRMGVECVKDHGTVWLEAFLDDGTTVALHEEEADDVTRFDVVGAYGESLDTTFAMSVSNIAAYGSGGATGAVPLGVAQLITAVPAVYRVDCARPPSTTVASRPAAGCYVEDEGDGAEMVDLFGFETTGALNTAFDGTAGTLPEGSCAIGPAQSTWSTAAGHGRMACTSLPFGMRLSWTDETTQTLGSALDLEGDYAKTFAQWSIAMEPASGS